MAKVLFSSPLRIYTRNRESCEINQGTIEDVVIQLGKDFPDLGSRLLRDDGTLRNLIVISVDGKDIRLLEREQTSVNRDSVIRLLPAIGGG
jgi:molybdopterin converting factor small subunit